MKEAAVEARLRQRVKALGGMAIKISPISQAGLPDRLVLLPGGRAFFVELKRPVGGRLSAIQLVVHPRLEALGFPVAVLNTTELVDQWLDSL